MLKNFWGLTIYIEMAEAQMANLIAQSNVALAETLAHALQGLRPAPVPIIKLGRFTGHPRGRAILPWRIGLMISTFMLARWGC